MDLLVHYDWPGNVRELQNVVERELIINPSGPLTFNQFRKGSKDITSSADQTPEDRFETTALDLVVSHHIQQILKQCGGKIHGAGGAAELLGINASTLRNKMNKLGIKYRKD